MKTKMAISIEFLIIFIIITCSVPSIIYGQSKVIMSFTDPDGESFQKAAVSNDGTMLAASTNHKTIVWDIETQEIINTYTGIAQAKCLDFSPDNRYLVCGGLSLKADVWDIKTGEAVLKIQQELNDFNYSDDITLAKFTSDGKYLIISGSPKLELWQIEGSKYVSDLTDMAYIHDYYPLNEPLHFLVYETIQDTDDETGNSFTNDLLTIRNILTGELVQTIASRSKIQSVSINRGCIVYHDDTCYNVGNYDVVVYDLEKDSEIFRTTKSSVNFEKRFAVSNQGKFYISSEYKEQSNLHLHSASVKRLMHSISMDEKTQPGQFGEVIIFPDDTKFLTRGYDQITIWDISDLSASVQNAEELD